MFTSEERVVLELYRNPKSSDWRRTVRLGVQYLTAAALFTCLAVAYQPWFAVATFLMLAAFVLLRVLGARRLAGVMPTILAKYEARIGELEGASSPNTEVPR